MPSTSDTEDAPSAFGRYTPFESVSAWTEIDVEDSEFQLELSKFISARTECGETRAVKVIDRLARKAAAESVALEGFYTLRPGESQSIANMSNDWEQILERESANNIRLFESQLTAYEYIRSRVDDTQVITEAFIRELHVIACKDQATYTSYTLDVDGRLVPQERQLKAGQYKLVPNRVVRRSGQTYWYAEPADVPVELHRLVQEMQSDDFRNLHPVAQTAFVHYVLTSIHPFDDGNGRTARALASLFTYKAYGVPLIVYSDRKQAYFQALEVASTRKYEPMVEYVHDRLVNTFGHAVQEFSAETSLSVQDELLSLVHSTAVYAGITVQGVREVSDAIRQKTKQILKNRLSELEDAGYDGLVFTINDVSGYPGAVLSYYPNSTRGYQIEAGLSVSVAMVNPVQASVVTRFEFGYAIDLSQRFKFRLSTYIDQDSVRNPPNNELKLRFEDCHPELGTDALDRVKLAVDRVISSAVQQLTINVQELLRQAGSLQEPQ